MVVNDSVAKFFSVFVLVACAQMFTALAFADEVVNTYLSAEEFKIKAFPSVTPKSSALWLDDSLKEKLRNEFEYRYHGLRVRYWVADNRTAWMLEEIGKEQPITLGIVVEAGVIQSMDVLVYRETRGGEIRFPFFTDQFKELTVGDKAGLSGRIDGITGATLSVRAAQKIARIALFFDSLTASAKS